MVPGERMWVENELLRLTCHFIKISLEGPIEENQKAWREFENNGSLLDNSMIHRTNYSISIGSLKPIHPPRANVLFAPPFAFPADFQVVYKNSPGAAIETSISSTPTSSNFNPHKLQYGPYQANCP